MPQNIIIIVVVFLRTILLQKNEQKSTVSTRQQHATAFNNCYIQHSTEWTGNTVDSIHILYMFV